MTVKPQFQKRKLRQRNNTLKSPIAHLVKAGRVKQGWTQKQLAEQIGVGISYVADMETGRKVPTKLATVRKLASLLHIDPDLFYTVQDRVPPDMMVFIQTNPDLIKQIRQIMTRSGWEWDPDTPHQQQPPSTE